MIEERSLMIHRAIEDFRSARQKATLREIIARFMGNSTELLSFDEVRQKLKAQIGAKKVLKEIPINAIIGSVNRYQDFSRDFLPLENINEERWANIELASQGSVGLPPIEAYQIDQTFFVSDGNHRVSVAKQLGATEIQAYVTEVQTRVPLTADLLPEDLILKSEYAEFLENTNLDKLRPDADLSVTVPGQYEVIEEHIAVHRYFMGIEQQQEIPLCESVADWYDNVYLPVVSIIRDRGLLMDFPHRTEADLYLWIADHRAALEEELKSQVAMSSAAADLVDQYSQRAARVFTRIRHKIAKVIVPAILEPGPPTGTWRRSLLSSSREDHLFSEILVPINGHQDGWFALQQALVIAHREDTCLHGLYVVESEDELESSITKDIQNEFTHQCEADGVQCDLQLKTGDITDNICDRARWNDLVVINLTYPPDSTALGRLSSGISNLIHRCPRPILFTPQVSTPLDHAMVAYDGSIKAQEALFIAAYVAGQWRIALHVVSIGDDTNISTIQEDAWNYLEDQDIQAEYLIANPSNNIEEVLNYINQFTIDLLLIGGYKRSQVVEIFQGSDVDEFLRLGHIPIITCR